jgi:transcriptional regulator with XRE-family HTH domain
MAAWNRGIHAGIATAIKDARRAEQNRFTANALADETSRLNYPISRSQIANYESGRTQSLDVCDLLVIAGALKVPPLALLFPGMPDATTEILPGQQTNMAAAKAAFVGDAGLLWPIDVMGQLNQLMNQLNAIQTGMGVMVGAGHLTASADGWTLGADEIRSQQHRRTPRVEERPQAPLPHQQMNADDIKHQEQELNAPLQPDPLNPLHRRWAPR